MSFDKIAEQRIREAMERGEFDNLPGQGKPINLDVYFNTPEDLRLGYSLLKGSGFIPEEVDVLRDIDALKAELALCDDEARRSELKRTISDRALKLRILLETFKRGSRRR